MSSDSQRRDFKKRIAIALYKYKSITQQRIISEGAITWREELK